MLLKLTSNYPITLGFGLGCIFFAAVMAIVIRLT